MSDIVSIQLDTPSVRPGDYVKGRVLFNPTKQVNLNQLILTFMGEEKSRIVVQSGSGKHRHSHYKNAAREMARRFQVLAPAGPVSPGSYSFDFAFDVPTSALPSYSGSDAWVVYELEAKADIPMWFDAAAKAGVAVISRSQELLGPGVVIEANIPGNLRGILSGEGRPESSDGPGFRVVLDRTWYMPGEEVTGNVTIFNPTGKSLRKLKMHLNGVEVALVDGRRESKIPVHHRVDVDIAGHVPGSPMPFSFPLPQKLQDTVEGSVMMFFWMLEAQLDVAWAFDVKAEAEIKVFH